MPLWGKKKKHSWLCVNDWRKSAPQKKKIEKFWEQARKTQKKKVLCENLRQAAGKKKKTTLENTEQYFPGGGNLP